MPRSSASKGFSLAEALVAIAIAALLAVVLTRLAMGTRNNAASIQELVNMMGVSESLLAQVAPKEPGTTNGRMGNYSWRIVVTPLKFAAVARYVNEKDSNVDMSPAKGPTVAEKNKVPTVAEKNKEPESREIQWVLYDVIVSVFSPSGRKYIADTIRIGARPKSDDD